MSKAMIVLATIAVTVFWIISIAYPFLAAFWLPSVDPSKVNTLASVLEQTSKYGDSFGAANSIFSGLALIAVVYTLHQQNENIERATRERREDAFLNALSSLANVYATIYASDTTEYDQENETGAARRLTPDCTSEEKKYTVKGKLYSYAKGLEVNMDRLRRGEDLDFPFDMSQAAPGIKNKPV